MIEEKSTIFIVFSTAVVLFTLGVISKFTIYSKEQFNYEPQMLEDTSKDVLDLPNDNFTDDEYKLRLQKLYPYD